METLDTLVTYAYDLTLGGGCFYIGTSLVFYLVRRWNELEVKPRSKVAAAQTVNIPLQLPAQVKEALPLETERPVMQREALPLEPERSIPPREILPLQVEPPPTQREVPLEVEMPPQPEILLSEPARPAMQSEVPPREASQQPEPSA
jgi:hypothetical protein